MLDPSRLQKSSAKSIRTLGIDLALNHAAFVQLKDGLLDKYLIVTNSKTIAATDKANSDLLNIKHEDIEIRSLLRLEWWKENFLSIFDVFEKADYIAIEDYAYSARQGAHQIGELGGMIRCLLWDMYKPWRKYSPGQVKLYAAHKGLAEKEEMVKAVKDRWGIDWSHLRPGKTKQTVSVEDAADATAIAHLLYTEVRLRKAEISLKELPEEEIRVFNTISKHSKTNLLDTPWITKNA